MGGTCSYKDIRGIWQRKEGRVDYKDQTEGDTKKSRKGEEKERKVKHKNEIILKAG